MLYLLVLLIHLSLLSALQPMDATFLDKLLSIDTNPNTQTGHYGNTPLIVEVFDVHDKGVQVLLNASADVKIQKMYCSLYLM